MINSRLAVCSYFTTRSWLRQDLQLLLRPLPDISRLLQRLYMRRGDAFDLLGIAKFIKTSQIARERLVKEIVHDDLDAIKSLPSDLDDQGSARRLLDVSLGDDRKLQPNAAQLGFLKLAEKIDATIDEDALQKRTTIAEKKASIAEILGTTQAERAIAEEEEGERGEGIWGKDREWVVRPKYELSVSRRVDIFADDPPSVSRSSPLPYIRPCTSCGSMRSSSNSCFSANTHLRTSSSKSRPSLDRLYTLPREESDR